MAALETYNSNEVHVTYANRPIDSGRAAGTFVKTAFNKEQWTYTPNADGGGTRSRTNDQSGKITLTVMRQSSAHRLLTQLYAQAQVSRGASDLATFELRDTSGGLKESAARTWIEKAPDSDYGSEIKECEWVLATDKLVRTAEAQ